MARIMVIDDDTAIRRVVRLVLERAGHDVVEAPDGRVALNRHRDQPVDLLLTDIYMPDMDGIELIIRLRRELPHAKIVAMSGGGHLDPNRVLEIAENLGALGMISKPFEMSDLVSLVDTALN